MWYKLLFSPGYSGYVKYWESDLVDVTQQPIKSKFLLSFYSQLCVVQYGEFGR